MAQMGQFDTVYHEHISFFCTNSMRKLMERAGLVLIDVMKTPVHGGSMVFVASRGMRGQVDAFQYDDSIEFSARSEDGLVDFANRADGAIGKVLGEVAEARRAGFTVAGYGAAAKGNTVLNYGKIMLDFIVDDNPLKQGRYTPGMRIPILSPDGAKPFCADTVVWVVLSWNFMDEIKTRIHKKFPECENRFIHLGFES